MTGSDPKQIARELLEEAHPALIGLSHWIHANPELGYQEVLASGWVTEWLTTAGFDVRTGVGEMPTSIVGSYGPGPFHIAVCVEYDALPAVGHACGHNVIAAAGVGAGLALAAVADQLGLKVTVMGTPAEETGGGKVGLIKAGEFDGVHAAMMVHPWPQDEATPTIIAIRSLNVAYTGKEAHAAGFPYLGINAADALVVAQTAIALLRQQLRTTDRVHGIVTKGGDAANIIPARTEAQWMVRGTDVARLDQVTAMVRRCFEAGALATGAALEIDEEICYADVRHDADLSRLYQSNMEQLGRTFSAPGMPVSTDMGNVSYVVPTIHPMIGIAADGAVNHQAAFAAACATPSADQAIFDGALAMAWTAIDAAQDPGLRERLMGFVAEPAEVAMVSSAWKMPPLPASATLAAPAAAEEGWSPVEPEPAADPVLEVEAEVVPEELVGAMALGEQLSELIDGPMEGQVLFLGAEPAEEATDLAVDADAAAGAEALDPDAAWAADVRAIEDQLVAAGVLTAVVEAAPEPETQPEAVADAVAEVAETPAAEGDLVGEVLFVGFDEPEAEAEPAPVEAVADAPVVAEEPAAEVLDVWVTPEVLGEWLESDAAPAADATPVAGTPAADEPLPWFATHDTLAAPAPVETPAPVEAPAPVAPVAAAFVAPAPAAYVAPAPVPATPAPNLRDRDAWEAAFEAAAAKLGWEEEFEAALRERMTDEGMDRSEAIADLASDLQEAAEDRAESETPASMPPGWATGTTETVSRERIEAEGFSFVAPDVTTEEAAADAWSRNGFDHASEDLRTR